MSLSVAAEISPSGPFTRADVLSLFLFPLPIPAILESWVLNSAAPRTNCVTLGKPHPVSESQFPHLQNRDGTNSTHPIVML